MNVKLDSNPSKLLEREIRNLELELEKSKAANYFTSIRIIRGEFETLRKENGQLKLEKEKAFTPKNMFQLRSEEASLEDKLNQIQFKLCEALKLNEKLTEDLNREKMEHANTENKLKLEKRYQEIYYERQLSKQRDDSCEKDVFHLKRKIYFLNEEIKSIKAEKIKSINYGIHKSRIISKLTAEVTELKEENKNLKEMNTKLMANSTNTDNCDKNCITIKQESQELNEEELFKLKNLPIMEGIFAELQEQHEQRGNEIIELNSKILGQSEKIQNLNSLNQDLIAKLAGLEKEVNRLKNQGSILEEINELSRRLTDKESVNIVLQNDKKILVNKNDSLKMQIKTLEAELNSIRSQQNLPVPDSKPKCLFTLQNWNENIENNGLKRKNRNESIDRLPKSFRNN